MNGEHSSYGLPFDRKLVRLTVCYYRTFSYGTNLPSGVPAKMIILYGSFLLLEIICSCIVCLLVFVRVGPSPA